MLFSSPIFLFLFMPLALGLYFLMPRRAKNYAALLASFIFYSWGEPRFIYIALYSALTDWLLGNLIPGAKALWKKKIYLASGIAINLGILFYFKYANFFANSIGALLPDLNFGNLDLSGIALPLGVSFIVFEKITYITDVYRGISTPQKNFFLYLLYVFFFPKLLAGPIIKYHDISTQLASRKHSIDDFLQGTFRFSIGLAKKVLIADTLAEVVNQVFKLPPGMLGFSNAWLGALCFTFQIYFDFSGYSDMAIGLGRMMGFRLLENFRMPYTASSFTDFWRRWHISFSTWVRDYLYIPLGGNRKGKGRMYFNLWFCFLLSGLWHGARWTFVAWGVYHGFFLVLDKLVLNRAQRKLPNLMNVGLTFLFLLFGWVVFRSENFGQVVFYFRDMFSPHSMGKVLYITPNIYFYLTLAVLFSFLSLSGFYERFLLWFRSFSYRETLESGTAFVLVLLSVSKISMLTFNPFLYFRF